MHYYQHNVGDYRKDTAHLTLLEHGIYRQLLDTYYLTEKPLTKDFDHIMRTHCVRNADEVQALKNVLDDFFVLAREGYIHSRCEAELGKIKVKSDKAREAANARWSTNKGKRNANAMRTHSERNADGMLPNNPIPNNPIKEKSNKKEKTAVKKIGLNFDSWPQVPSPEVLSDFKKNRKSPLTQSAVKLMAKQLDIAAENNMTVDECLAYSCEAGWQSFKYDWYLNREKANGTNRQNSSTSKHQTYLDNLKAL